MRVPVELIISRKNRICVEIRKLRTSRAYRRETGRFLADGVKLVEEALKWSAHVETLVISESCRFDCPDNISAVYVADDIMQYVSSMDAPQGVLAICRLPETENREIRPGTLVLDSLQDPGNMGTIIRTADAFDIPVVITENCVDPYNEKTVRASMGAIFRSPPVLMRAESIITACREARIPLAITSLQGEPSDIRETDLSRLAVVIGNEGHGVSKLFSDTAEEHLIIPMNPRCESLNAGVAAAVVMWQIRSGR